MSTKATIAYSDEFHFYHECFDKLLKSSTLRTILTQAGIAREDFLVAYDAV